MFPSRETQEKCRHSTALVPYSHYVCSIPFEIMNVPMHWHSEFEINYIVRGQGEFICGSERYLAKTGDLLLIPPNQLHASFPLEKNELLYHALVFSPQMLGAGAHDRAAVEYIRPLISGARKVTPLIPRSAQNYSRLKACAGEIFSCLTNAPPCPELLLKSELFRFFWLLETDGARLVKTEENSDCGENIRPALEYMMNNFHESISVLQLAGITHLSESYFMSSFKKAVGVSAIEYLGQLRVNAACEALSSTDKMVSEIAFSCGYGNLSNFNRQFKRTMGCSPNEYRKNSRATAWDRAVPIKDAAEKSCASKNPQGGPLGG